jgi:hypothetical protein
MINKMRKGEIKIGAGHSISFLYEGFDSMERVGLIHHHRSPEGFVCDGGSVLFDVPENEFVPAEQKWQLTSLHPLTLSPSLLCSRCGDHGYIKSGRWEKC